MAKRHGWLLLSVALAAGVACQGQNATGQVAIGEVFSGDASVRGSVLLSAQGAHVLSGSEVAAGDGTALLKLKRGGEIRICPKTDVSLNSDASGKALAMGLSVGSMELNYTLSSAADSVMTPDLRLQLISPGTFHLAISVGPTGDTCLRTLPGDDAAVFVAEMMGSDSYQLSPGKSVLFGGGKIAAATEAPEACGCPESAPAMHMAARTTPATLPATASAANQAVNPAATSAATSAATQAAPAAGSAVSSPHEASASAATSSGTPSVTSSVTPARASLPAASAEAQAKPPEAKRSTVAHLESESRFVYQGNGAGDDFYSSVSRLSLSGDESKLSLALLPRVSGPPPPPPAPVEKKTGFLHWLRRLFGR